MYYVLLLNFYEMIVSALHRIIAPLFRGFRWYKVLTEKS